MKRLWEEIRIWLASVLILWGVSCVPETTSGTGFLEELATGFGSIVQKARAK